MPTTHRPDATASWHAAIDEQVGYLRVSLRNAPLAAQMLHLVPRTDSGPEDLLVLGGRGSRPRTHPGRPAWRAAVERLPRRRRPAVPHSDEARYLAAEALIAVATIAGDPTRDLPPAVEGLLRAVLRSVGALDAGPRRVPGADSPGSPASPRYTWLLHQVAALRVAADRCAPDTSPSRGAGVGPVPAADDTLRGAHGC